ncbi:DUF4132 domain-containing protein [Mucilaginibacter conchicola]|uniref:DUF4132 domain-containing protein n=1 Tax=Mucilaginibacter conchicola TaxID=2303333 RepID=A0A372P0E6_9SPHI|nr:DUF4132 domain-containing protein [Mucilaginibacter conchicola]RFZ95752.1 DUF4132 domain-containing protein [Mucilaginibacter conchicola]
MNLFDKIKNVFSKNTSAEQSAPAEAGGEFAKVIDATHAEYSKTSSYFWSIKLNQISVYTDDVAKWDDKKKIAMILYCIRSIGDYYKQYGSGYSSTQLHYQKKEVTTAYLSQLFKTKLLIDSDDLNQILQGFYSYKKWDWSALNTWPIAALLNQLTNQYGKTGIPGKMPELLTGLKTKIEEINYPYYQKDKLKLTEKIDNLIFKTNAGTEKVKPTLFLGDDPFSAHANQAIEALPQDERIIWYQLIAKAIKASGSKPSNKYLQESKDLFKELGTDKFKAMLNNWFLFVVDLKENTVTTTHTFDNRIYNYSTSTFLSAINTDSIKGFVWMASHFHDNTTLNNLAKLAERCYKKMPGIGPAAGAVGNAALFALYKSKGLDGIGHLSRLKLRIKQSNIQQLIEKYINEAAKEQGVSAHEIEDMAMDDHGLTDGAREFQFENFSCILKITGPGKSELNWYKADGVQQKTVPALVKGKFAARLKKLKELQKQIDQTTSAQRDRIDRMFRTGRTFTFTAFKEFFLDHGLMSFLTKQIIWNVTKNGQTTAILQIDGQWVDNNNTPVTLTEEMEISLWHPATVPVAEVKKWRDLLTQNQIRQPLKQAFREVYLLTEAEVNTRTYSNRMAAHVLKQHQFNTLAKSRGWRYSLLGAYDDGRDNGTAEVNLPEYGLRAQYWVNEVNADNAYNDTGIWNYITTDQVRFVDTNGNIVNLIDVPVLPFSEVLRDVDLFVGVASVGNDPTWQDSGGVPALNNYWQSYSFGDLSELAKNRKEILTNLLPRLKIAKVAEIKDKFVVVKGKLRTYKIHIGSTNILMEPNDQYLCIVPDRSQKNLAENLFIPFEGDAGMSVILSKAFLLAEDDKITDTTITSQINRR